MRKNNNIIEINGQRYDAKTGAVLSVATRHSRPAKPKPTMHDVVRRPATAHTLMRQAVKKPKPSLKRQIKAQSHVDVPSGRPLGRLTVKKSAERLDAERLRHAKKIPRSRLISHFPPLTAGDYIKVRTVHQPAAATTSPAPSPTPKPAKRGPKTTSELLEQAVRQATSHLEPPPKQTRRRGRAKRKAGVGAAVALTVLALGIIVAQNQSNGHLNISSAKAGLLGGQSSHQAAGPDIGQFNRSGSTAAAQLHDNDSSR